MKSKSLRNIFLILILIEGFFNVGVNMGVGYDFINFDDFLEQYNNAPASNKTDVLDDYLLWQENNGGFPAIQNNTEIVFIYFSVHYITTVDVVGDFNSWGSQIPMTKLESDVSFFYKKMSFESSARLDYKFVKDGSQWIVDPRNPNTVTGGFGPNSELSMPEFIQPTEIIPRTNISHGEITTLSEPWTSPKVQVYLPPNYTSNKTYSTFYTSDGSEYLSLASAAVILDNLIADKRIDPVIGVFIDPLGDRVAWYRCNPDYLTYLDGLVEFIDNTYSTNNSAYNRLHLGDSMGGIVSAYVGLERNETFKLVGSHSGAFWTGNIYGILPKYNAVSPSIGLKMWFSAGTYESSIYDDTKIMENYSIDKGWETEAIYLFEGHSWGSWRHTFDDMMDFFFPYTGDYEDDTSNGLPSEEDDKKKIIGPSAMLILGLISLTTVRLIQKNRKKRR
jgi:enterochelin esterase family protein